MEPQQQPIPSWLHSFFTSSRRRKSPRQVWDGLGGLGIYCRYFLSFFLSFSHGFILRSRSFYWEDAVDFCHWIDSVMICSNFGSKRDLCFRIRTDRTMRALFMIVWTHLLFLARLSSSTIPDISADTTCSVEESECLE